jgi:hypothetical protein
LTVVDKAWHGVDGRNLDGKIRATVSLRAVGDRK